MKKSLIAIAVIFVVGAVLDFLIHGMLLKDMYMATAQLWRPMAEMKMGLGHVVSLVSISAFVAIYTLFFKEKSLENGMKYGALVGVMAGASMGAGTYTYMPIPATLACAWTVATLIHMTIAGTILGWVTKK